MEYRGDNAYLSYLVEKFTSMCVDYFFFWLFAHYISVNRE